MAGAMDSDRRIDENFIGRPKFFIDLVYYFNIKLQ